MENKSTLVLSGGSTGIYDLCSTVMFSDLWVQRSSHRLDTYKRINFRLSTDGGVIGTLSSVSLFHGLMLCCKPLHPIRRA